MEKDLIPNNQGSGQELATSGSTFPLLNQQLFNVIKDLNMLVPFPYTDSEIMQWSLAITRVKPKTTVEVIRKMTDQFLSGSVKFDKNKGLLNYTERVYEYLGIFE